MGGFRNLCKTMNATVAFQTRRKKKKIMQTKSYDAMIKLNKNEFFGRNKQLTPEQEREIKHNLIIKDINMTLSRYSVLFYKGYI